MTNKFINRDTKAILEEAMNNEHTKNPLGVITGTGSNEKMTIGILRVMDLMYALNHYDEAKSAVSNNDDIFNKMVSNAKEMVNAGGPKL